MSPEHPRLPDGTLAIDARGASGRPVLFVHSFAGDRSHWTAQLAHLADSRRVVAFDMRGHGESPEARDPYSIRLLADDVGAAADQSNLERFILVGHSIGADIVAEYASSAPTRVLALILVDAPPVPGAVPPQQVEQISKALDADPYATIEQFWNQQAFANSRSEVRARLLAGLRRMSRRAAIELTKDLFRYDATAALRRFTGPMFAVVTPQNDGPLSLHHAVPGITHAVIDGTSHWIHLDKPDEFSRVLDGFLQRIDATR
jgi:pimeloyl-ACP methyl ester carboxylesterase